MAKMLLGDDGTLDTVIYCADCGQEFRFNYEPEWQDEGKEEPYLAFVEWAKREAAEDHAGECVTDAKEAV